MRTGLFACVLPCALLVAIPATAQSARDPVAATELFRQGRDAMAAKDYATACPKFDESARLDPRVGTLLNLAECDEALTHFASARQHWQQAADLAEAQGDPRASFASDRLAAIDKRVARLVVRVEGSRPEGLVVERDGVEIRAPSFGVPLPVDSGTHTVVARAPGFHEWRGEVEAHDGDVALALTVPPLDRLPAPPVAAQGEAPAPPAAAIPPLPPQESSGKGQRIIAVSLLGVGVVGLTIGTVFGLETISKNNGSKSHCDGDVCDSEGASLRTTARSDGNLSTLAYSAGAGFVAAGAIVWLLTPSGSRSTAIQAQPLVVARGGGAALRWVW